MLSGWGGQRAPVEMAVLLFCWLSPQGTAGEAEAGAPGADPTAAPAAPLRGNPVPQDQQPPQAGWVPEPCSTVGGLGKGQRFIPMSPATREVQINLWE